MSVPSLNISGKIEPENIALFERIGKVAKQLNIPYVVVGAYARDLVLHYGHGAAIQRATMDIDLGIQVSDWSAFEQLKQALLNSEFKETRSQHRFISPENIKIDIVPFGQIEDCNANIQWPPSGDVELNVLGFQEAHYHSETVRIQNEPTVDIPVATATGMTLLKLISWADRTIDMRKKDAKDLRYLIVTYEKIPAIKDVLYNDATLMVQYDWELELASAHQLGADVKSIAGEKTQIALAALFHGEHKKLSVERLMEEMSDPIEREYERNERIIKALIAGFLAT